MTNNAEEKISNTQLIINTLRDNGGWITEEQIRNTVDSDPDHYDAIDDAVIRLLLRELLDKGLVTHERLSSVHQEHQGSCFLTKNLEATVEFIQNFNILRLR